MFSDVFQTKTCFLLIFIIDAAACVFTAPYAYHVELARVSDAEDAVSEQDTVIHGYSDKFGAIEKFRCDRGWLYPRLL